MGHDPLVDLVGHDVPLRAALREVLSHLLASGGWVGVSAPRSYPGGFLLTSQTIEHNG